MTTTEIIIVLESVLVVALATALIVFLVKKNKKKKNDKHAVYVKDGVRYTYQDETERDGNVAVTHREGDIILEKGVTYVVGEKNGILPGKYTVLAAQETTPAFNIRMGDFVREYKHDSGIVLAEGEKICPVSHSVILR